MDKALKEALETMMERTVELNDALDDPEHTDATLLLTLLCTTTFAQSAVIAKLCVMLDTGRVKSKGKGL